ncbi:putative SAM dependent methyltransferase [Tieghemostelium lacteum]|uniref:Putative SAM dependent methyltransferase n=1 Tax=Tieghemostelium lacteum TaxID=361077 RepID=A0A151ZSH9_TIELA|nr:putative SAM dependent methyltransferase [Tieghemostelium lacteum]|eukprot:KYQ96855.1 putative SAM dependent methyltransferase [Tieghemostelium lacteum]
MTTNTKFQDLFGDIGKYYRENRPSYPVSLYEMIDNFVDDKRDLCVDVACGSGQASIGMSKLFKKVIGLEPSEGQLKNAIECPNVEYRQSTAESINLPNESVDCITVATAIHWFDIPKFFSEADRLLRPGGSLCIWSYRFPTIVNNSTAEEIHQKYYMAKVGPYWDEKPRHHMLTSYSDVVPPFKNTTRKILEFNYPISITKFIGRLNSQSAYSTFLKSNSDILPELKELLMKAYNVTDENQECIEIANPFFLIMSKKE